MNNLVKPFYFVNDHNMILNPIIILSLECKSANCKFKYAELANGRVVVGSNVTTNISGYGRGICATDYGFECYEDAIDYLIDEATKYLTNMQDNGLKGNGAADANRLIDALKKFKQGENQPQLAI